MNARAEAIEALHARGARLCRFVWDAKAERKKAYRGDATDMRGCTLAEALAWADDKWLAINAGDLRLAVVDQDHGGEAAREALHELLPTPLHWYPTREDRSRSHSLYPVEKGTPASKFDWQNGEVFGPQQWAIVRDFHRPRGGSIGGGEFKAGQPNLCDADRGTAKAVAGERVDRERCGTNERPAPY